jgi:class 3 adenylate cyclase
MDRVWQWLWDRFGTRYSWAISVVTFFVLLPIYLTVAFLVVGFEESGRYVEAAVFTIAAAAVWTCGLVLPSLRRKREVEQWASGHGIDRTVAMEATYSWARGAVARSIVVTAVCATLHAVLVGVIAGATAWECAEYAMLGVGFGVGVMLVAVHSFTEAALRPARIAIAGETGIGDFLPRSRPSFAAWSNVSMIAASFAFATLGAMIAAAFGPTYQAPVFVLVIGFLSMLIFGVPLTVGVAYAPSLRPIRDLAEGTERVAAGDYSQRLPVVQDDDLGALAASFNRMQAGLAERQRLQAAFGTYVDPALAARLLEQGDDIFTGERRDVTVMFVDIRDFTPFAEANTAEDTVSRLNALFGIVVPAVVDAGGHVNKFLGDGALAVFGAPNELADHADAAVGAAVRIQRLVAERFGGTLRIGIGINTGVVIAGTIGGGGKLEFTLIGDTVNVAARVEQLTKTTGDTILLTQYTVDALVSPPPGLTDRGAQALKGKSALVNLFGLAPTADLLDWPPTRRAV